MFNKKLTVATVILAVLALGATFFIEREKLSYTPNISDFGKNEAFALTKTYLKEQGIPTEDFTFSYGFDADRNRDAFFNKNFSQKEIRAIFKKQNTPEGTYSVRVSKNLEKEEYRTRIDPVAKKVVGFTKIVAETKEEKTVTKDVAREISLAFLETAGYQKEKLEDYDYVEQKLPKRSQQTFIFKIRGTEIDTSYGTAFKKVAISSSGGIVYGFSEEYFIPEKFTREISGEKSYGILFAILSFLVSLIMIVSAIVVFFKQARKMGVRSKLFLGIAVLLFIFSLVDFLNGINTLKFLADTSIDLKVSFAIGVTLAIIVSLVVSLGIFVVGSAGDSYQENRGENNFFKNVKQFLFSREQALSIYKGYAIAAILTGITSILYFVGERYLGVWSYGDSGMIGMLFTSSIPAFSIFLSIALFPAVSEELLYRYFGIRFFGKITKSLFFGVVLSSLVWAVSHMTYDVFPVYFRGIELLLVGSILGLYFLRWGIVTTITAHYAHNAAIALLAAYFLTSGATFYSIIFVFMLPAIITLPALFAKNNASTLPLEKLKEGNL